MYRKGLFLLCFLASFLPMVTSPGGLLLGVFAALAFGNQYQKQTEIWTTRLLQIAVVGLGAGMDLNVVLRVGAQGISYTVVGITLTLALGWMLAKLLKVEKETSLLISVGTAICGGSAIAAVAPTIRAKSESTSVALAAVFLFNAAALFLFPFLGHTFDLSQRAFGLWSALAIHDTSSVVGAASTYGPLSVQIATTVKLARALWILPLTLGIGLFYKTGDVKPKKPWFILGFLAMAALVTYVPVIRENGQNVYALSKRLLVVTLFLIGSGLSKDNMKKVGSRPFIFGVLLWFVVAGVTLVALKNAWIS